MKTSAMILVAGMCMSLFASVAAHASDRNQPTTSRAPEVTVAAVPSAATEAATPNCLLPGQIHNFGGVALLMPKHAVTLAPAECTERGGEPMPAATAAN